MRIAHVTDIHWMVRPRLSQLTFKRALGAANLFLAGRSHHFDEGVQSALVRDVRALAPDLVVCTGDLTATAIPEEFEKARTALAPLLDELDFFTIPGNHDVYTREAQRARRIHTFFGPWMGLEPDQPYPSRKDVGPVTLIGLDPNRPTSLESSSVVPRQQLEGLEAMLAEDDLAGQTILLLIHYPVISREGGLYDGFNHGLRNASELVQVLEQAPHRPTAILSGHVHHGYRSELQLAQGSILQLNPGSSGYAHLPEKDRAAAFNVYDIDEGGLAGIERYRFDGERFVPEAGGAYASGR